MELEQQINRKKTEISVNLVLVPVLVGVSTPAWSQLTLLEGEKKTVFLNITNKHFYRSDFLKSQDHVTLESLILSYLAV